MPQSYCKHCQCAFEGYPSGAPPYELVWTDPWTYDRAALEYLATKYHPTLFRLFQQLEEGGLFESDSLDADFKGVIDPTLIMRQVVPAYALADAFGVDPDELVGLTKSYVVMKTLSLNALDTFVDSAMSYTVMPDFSRDHSAKEISIFALGSMLRGTQNLLGTEAGIRFLRTFTSTYADVLEIMYEDVTNRYQYGWLDSPLERLSAYEHVRLSPYLGSGFYTTMIVGAADYLGIRIHDPTWVSHLRRLRQCIDELADVREDLLAGRLTFPLLLALSKPQIASELRQLITKIWRKAQPIVDSENKEIGRAIQGLAQNSRIETYWLSVAELLEVSGVWNGVYSRGCALYHDAIATMQETLPHVENDIFVVAALKRAFLERLRLQNWTDEPVLFRIDTKGRVIA